MISELENSVATFFDRKYCVLVGSGTTALYVIYKALALQENTRIIYPDITCDTALNAAIYAGLSPVFCDIELKTYNMDILSLPSENGYAPEIIVPTHIFGNLMDIPALQRHVRGSEVFILEDAAQAVGGTLNGIKAGGMGNASIVSFGKGKTIDCGSGGAVLTDSVDLYEECLRVAGYLNNDLDIREEMKKRYMKEMFGLTRNVTDNKELIGLRDRLKVKYKDAYIFKIDDEGLKNLSLAFRNPEVAIERRKKNTETVRASLASNPNVMLPESLGEPILWRYSFMVNNRDSVYDTLVNSGIRVSTYFKPLHSDYAIPDDSFPNAQTLYDKVINLFLNFEESEINSLTRNLSRILDRINDKQ